MDRPSENIPIGAKRKLFISSEEMKKALPLLKGMPINAEFNNLSSHAPETIIGVITDAWIDKQEVKVEGHLFGANLPEEVEVIQAIARSGELGMSIEMDAGLKEVDYQGETVEQVHGLTPLGAAILFKDRAAYNKTRLAAQKEVEKVEETIKEIKAAIEEMKGSMVTKEDIKDFITAEALEGLAKTEEVVKVEDLEVKDVVKAEALEGFVKEDALKTFITAENLEESLKKITDRLVELEKKPVVEPQPIHAGTEEDVVTRLQKKMFA